VRLLDVFGSRPMASFPGFTVVSNNRFQINYTITITLTLNFRLVERVERVLCRVKYGSCSCC